MRFAIKKHADWKEALDAAFTEVTSAGHKVQYKRSTGSGEYTFGVIYAENGRFYAGSPRNVVRTIGGTAAEAYEKWAREQRFEAEKYFTHGAFIV